VREGEGKGGEGREGWGGGWKGLGGEGKVGEGTGWREGGEGPMVELAPPNSVSVYALGNHYDMLVHDMLQRCAIILSMPGVYISPSFCIHLMP
jgi:hypothetical protein